MIVDKKRRKKAKTNYNKRLILLKSKALRLVIRKTNKYIILQIIESKHALDKVLYYVNTKELLKHGWPENKAGGLKSTSAAYLGGVLLGKKIKNLDKRIILDSGLIPSTKGSRVYAGVKGLADSGIEIKYDKKIIPSQDRIQGKHMKQDFSEDFKKILEKIGGKLISDDKNTSISKNNQAKQEGVEAKKSDSSSEKSITDTNKDGKK